MTESRIRERLEHAAWWMSGARLLSILLNMTWQIVLARLLTPDNFGSFALLTSTLSLTALFGMRGMNEVSVRFIPTELAVGGQRRAARAAIIALRFALLGLPFVSLITFLLYWTLGDRLVPGMSQRWDFALLLAVGGALLAVQQLGADSLRGFHELRWASLFAGGRAGGPLCVLTFVVLTLVFGWRENLSLINALALYVIAIGGVLPLTWSRVRMAMRQTSQPVRQTAESPATLRADMFRMGLTMMAVQVLAFAANQSDLWIGSQLLPRDQLGLYHASRRMVILIGIPMQVTMITIASTIAELRAKNELPQLQRLLGSAAALAGIPSLGAFLLLAFFAKPFLGIVFGAYYEQAMWPLVILIAGYVSLALCGSPIQVLNVSGGHTASLWINVISCVLMFALAPILATRFGINGLATASAVSFTFHNVAAWIVARRMLGIWTHANLRALVAKGTTIG